MSRCKCTTLLGSTLALLFALRWMVAVGIATDAPQRLYRPDSHTYEGPAQALLQAGRFAVSPERLNEPQLSRTPVYPLLIAAVYAVTGRQPLAIVGVQIALALGTALLTGAIARELALAARPNQPTWAVRAQAWATGLMLIDPLGFTYANQILTETLAAALTALLVWLLLWGLRRLRQPPSTTLRRALMWATGAGLLVAAGLLTRPIGFLLGPPVALWLYLAMGQRLGTRRLARTLCAAAVLVVWLAGWLGWCARNERVSGWWGLSQISSINLLYYRAAGQLAWRQGITVEAAQRQIRQAHPQIETLPPAEAAHQRSAVAKAYFRADPVALLAAQGIGLARLVLDAGDADLYWLLGGQLGPQGVLKELHARGLAGFVTGWMPTYPAWFGLWLYCLGFMLLGYAAALAGTLKLLRLKDWRSPELWLLLGILAYFTVLSAGAEAYARFRVPFLPCLLALAGCGLAGLGQTGRIGRNRTQ